MNRCDWCLEECRFLTPVDNRDSTASHDFDHVCSDCAEIAYSERAGGVLLGFVAIELSGFTSSGIEYVSTTVLHGERIA